MDSLMELESKIKKAKIKRRELILEAMDGRTQKYIAQKAGILEPKLSKWINGYEELEEAELEKLSNVLGVDFK